MDDVGVVSEGVAASRRGPMSLSSSTPIVPKGLSAGDGLAVLALVILIMWWLSGAILLAHYNTKGIEATRHLDGYDVLIGMFMILAVPVIAGIKLVSILKKT